MKHLSPGDFGYMDGYEAFAKDQVSCLDERTGRFETFTSPTIRKVKRMTQEEYATFMHATFDSIRHLVAQKNADYTAGSKDAFANFRIAEEVGVPALKGVAMRFMDKVQRLKSFLLKGRLEVPNEGVQDSLKDLIAYSVIMLALLAEETHNEE